MTNSNILNIQILNRPTPRLESLHVRNYRALRNLKLAKLTPLTVLLGPNGSGKSTVFDVFAFLAECFQSGLRRAWDKRGRFKELRTRGQDGPITFELKYREAPGQPVILYRLAIDEDAKGPYIAEERLQWTRGGKQGRPFTFLEFREGAGSVVSGELPDESAERTEERLDSREALAVNALGQFMRHPRVSALRRFIAGWYLSYISAECARGVPEAGPQERLGETGANLANVVQYLKEQHPARLAQIVDVLRQRIPMLDQIDTSIMQDSRLLLQIKDAPFDEPILSRFASDGTLKLLAYLTVLYDPDPPPLIGIEEPENHLHPKLLSGLARECHMAAECSQIMVTTHSPFFVNGLSPDEVWVLFRSAQGFTCTKRAAEAPFVGPLTAAGGHLGDLWMEGYFDVGDPEPTLARPQPRLFPPKAAE